MFNSYFILVLLFLTLTIQSCATQVEEPDVEPSIGENSEESGDKRSFDPCKLNNKLPVCKDQL